MLACVCVCVCHTDFSPMLSLFGEFEVSFELAGQGHAIFSVSHNFTHSFTQFHAIFMQFYAILAILAIFGPISTCWVSKSMYSS